MWSPGEYLVIDWAQAAPGLFLFCAVLALSRWRFVAFATDERATTTLALIAEALAAIGGVPARVLADRMALPEGRGGRQRGRPDPGLRPVGRPLRVRPGLLPRPGPAIEGDRGEPVRLRPTRPGRPAAHRGRDRRHGRWTCEAANTAAAAWCAEVNAAVHSEICAVPDERLLAEREVLRPLPSLRLQIGAPPVHPQGRPAVLRPVRLRPLLGADPADRHQRAPSSSDTAAVLIAEPATGRSSPTTRWPRPGSASILDAHYDGPRPAPQPRATTENHHRAAVLRARRGRRKRSWSAPPRSATPDSARELEILLALGAAHGTDALVAALPRAVAFRRFRAADVRSILAAGTGAPQPRPRRRRRWSWTCRSPRPGRWTPTRSPPGTSPTATVDLMTTTHRRPRRPSNPLHRHQFRELPADLDAGLRRLKLAAIRRTAPEVLLTAKTQRWTPEEVLRTLIEAELTARDASNTVNRLKAAAFPVAKTLDAFDVAASSIPPNTFDYLTSLEWIRSTSESGAHRARRAPASRTP